MRDALALWTGNDDQARAAKADGLALYRGDLTEDLTSGVPSDLEGLEYAFGVGDDEALNAMIATDLSEYFGRGQVFQLAVTGGRAADFYTRVPVLFDDSATHDELLARIEAGDDVAVAQPAGANGATDLRARLGADGIPMFVLTPGKDLHVLAAGDQPPLKAGQELIGMIKPS